MKKILSVSLCLAFVFACIFLTRQNCVFADCQDEVYSYLLVAHDDAGYNTDVLAIMSYNPRDNAISLIQIPRDTYLNFGFYQNKINQIYPYELSLEKSKEEALKSLTTKIADSFGIKIKGYISVDSQSFVGMIDKIGGVKIDIPNDFKYINSLNGTRLSLEYGVNLLSGKDVFKFVRYRADYLGGDLERIDTQKIFFSGLFDTIKSGLENGEHYNYLKTAREYLKCDFSLMDIIVMAIKHSSKFKDVCFMFMTMPGEAIQAKSGLWYYQINRSSTMRLIKKYLRTEGEMKDVFVNADEKKSKQVFSSENIDYKVYTHFSESTK